MSGRIPEMINMLHSMITEAWGVPLGAEKCVIERDKALDILDEIRSQFPTEIAEAKRLLDARQDFINNAKREADVIKRNAEEQARRLVDEQEIIRISRKKSNEMLTHAESSSAELRRAANEYVDECMQRTEEALSSSLDEVKHARARFRQAAKEASKPIPQAPPTRPPIAQKPPRSDIDLDL